MIAICQLSIIPVRKTPSDSSEMVNQLLFGEQVIILSELENWYFTKSILDNYEGYVDKKQLKVILELQISEFIVTQSLFQLKNSTIKVEKYFLAGSYLKGNDINHYLSERNNPEEIAKIPLQIKNENAVLQAYKFLGAPYLWGGRSIFGIDCSGLTQIAFRLIGINIKRDAYEQAEMGKLIEDFNQVLEGDLAFFNKGNGNKITHVGIIIQDKEGLKIIHASGKVKINSLTVKGIVDEENKISHHYLFSRRILNTAL